MGFDIELITPKGESSHYKGEATCDLFWELANVSDYLARIHALEFFIQGGNKLNMLNTKTGCSVILTKAA